MQIDIFIMVLQQFGSCLQGIWVSTKGPLNITMRPHMIIAQALIDYNKYAGQKNLSKIILVMFINIKTCTSSSLSLYFTRLP